MSKKLHVVVGLGVTGLSCVRFLREQGIPVAVTDTRENPPSLIELRTLYPDVPVSLGQLDEKLLQKAETLVVSPGLSIKEPAIAKQATRGIPVIGDIELFAQAVRSPIIAITGTNAKSTVTTLVGKMAEMAGLRVQVGGNLGIPALDLLTPATPPELFVLELSSFQLETTFSLRPRVATVLNVTPDHMDRYANLREYQLAKHRVYQNAEVVVCNRDDPLTDCTEKVATKYYFTLHTPQMNEFGLMQRNREYYLAFKNQILMPVSELPILGRHYQANALAAIALGYGFGLPMSSMIDTLRMFKGLPHRCQLVRERRGIRWYNDSKGTNVGATLAAIEGLGGVIQGKLILIAGGVGKNADFSPLVPVLEKYVKQVVLIGEASTVLADVMGDRIPHCFANDMQQAIAMADQLAEEGDSVLLSPACASFDMFKNFEHRGDVFVKLVEAL